MLALLGFTESLCGLVCLCACVVCEHAWARLVSTEMFVCVRMLMFPHL